MKIKRRIRKSEVQEKMGWGASVLNERVNEGYFPAPTYERKIPYWSEEEVDSFIDKFFNPDASDQDNHSTSASC